MRTREEIENSSDKVSLGRGIGIVIELLLDIRDLLVRKEK